EAIVGKGVLRELPVGIGIGFRSSIAAKRRRSIRFRELLSHRPAGRDRVGDGPARRFTRPQHLREPLGLRQPVAARKEERSCGAERSREEASAIVTCRIHGVPPVSTRYRPVTIERRWFHSPDTITSNTWIATKATRSHAATKWIVRAACRPPKRSTQPGNTEFIHGLIATPIRMMSGSRMKITMRYVSFCSTL